LRIKKQDLKVEIKESRFENQEARLKSRDKKNQDLRIKKQDLKVEIKESRFENQEARLKSRDQRIKI
jgi:transcription antitermination factor NusG